MSEVRSQIRNPKYKSGDKKRKSLFFLLLCFCLSLVLFQRLIGAQEFQFVMTGHNWNDIGRSYEGRVDSEGLKVLIKTAKLYYLKGVYMGVQSEVMVDFRTYLLTEIGDDELLNYVDMFYSDPKNLDIPVPYALRIIAKDVAGEPGDEVSGKLEFLRESFRSVSRERPESSRVSMDAGDTVEIHE